MVLMVVGMEGIWLLIMCEKFSSTSTTCGTNKLFTSRTRGH